MESTVLNLKWPFQSIFGVVGTADLHGVKDSTCHI
jgi:hypothetical protein